ncbi:hypothetical protein [Comamonas terrigena]|uniref:hypothetical protein n=1 Tax=Comamonas terrigena TaxID=32013 RepID=UPI0028A0E292|nr:hypothetical protein [Comamonas terrigena]
MTPIPHFTPASRDELLLVTQRIEAALSAQTEILQRLAIAETKSSNRDQAIDRLAAEVAALGASQQATSTLIAKAAGAAGLAGLLLPYAVKFLGH